MIINGFSRRFDRILNEYGVSVKIRANGISEFSTLALVSSHRGGRYTGPVAKPPVPDLVGAAMDDCLVLHLPYVEQWNRIETLGLPITLTIAGIDYTEVCHSVIPFRRVSDGFIWLMIKPKREVVDDYD
jgi:hypothetical protein